MSAGRGVLVAADAAAGARAPAGSGTGVVHRVLAEARRGASVGTIAARLGMPADLVAAVVAELVTTGVVVQPGCSVTSACAAVGQTQAPVSCAGCPLSR